MDAPSSGKHSAGAERRAATAAVRALEWSRLLRQHAAFGYVMAFVFVGLATGLQWLAREAYDGAPFLTIYPAVILTTFAGGLGAGLLSAALSGFVQWGMFIPVLHWGGVASYGVDATMCVLLIVLINRSTDLLLASIDSAKQESSTSLCWRRSCTTAFRIFLPSSRRSSSSACRARVRSTALSSNSG